MTLLRYPFVALLTLLAMPVSGQTAFFNDPTDTIEVDGQTVIGAACTYEVVIRIPGDGGTGGMVFNEWTNFQEDKQLRFAFGGEAASTIVGYNWPAGAVLQDTITVTPDAWHHVAFVYDGTEERLYYDGALLASRPLTISVGDGAGLGHVGAVDRDNTVFSSFVGYLQSLRLSSVARYTGDAFPPPLGDLPSDANTLLLFNFNEAAGSATVQDESPQGRTGTLGVGFSGATPPQLGPVVATEPGAGPPSAVLHGATPNPTRGRATVAYDVPTAGPVRMTVHDLLGREVTVLVDGQRPAGRHAAGLDAGRLAPGHYVVRLESGGEVRTRWVTLVR